MKLLTGESSNLTIADEPSPIEFQGYLDGELCRHRGRSPSAYEQVGIDEYALGFRAGYYKRQASNRTGNDGQTPVTEMFLAVRSRVNNPTTADADLIERFPNLA